MKKYKYRNKINLRYKLINYYMSWKLKKILEKILYFLKYLSYCNNKYKK